MKIYVAINNGDWLDRHNRRPDIVDTDWWHNPAAKLFRNASAGDLFFVKLKHPNNELHVSATLKRDYIEEPAARAWRQTAEAYSADLTYQERAAGVLEIPVEKVTQESTIGLIALENLIWFPAEDRPMVNFNKFTVTGRMYAASDPEYEYLMNFLATHPNATVHSEAIRNTYIRVTEAQLAEILPLHTEMASRFEKWLKKSNYRDVQRERAWVDVRFRRDAHTFMAELKICYGMNTRQAIREALGQVLEYNHYSGRMPAEEWWIILDQQPTPSDTAYIANLQEQHLLPLHLGYETGPGIGEFIVFT